MSSLGQTDPEISCVIGMEAKRRRETINLIASENYASRAVLEAQGSFLTDKYAEGSSFMLTMPMSSRTAGLRLIWQPTTPCLTMVIL